MRYMDIKDLVRGVLDGNDQPDQTNVRGPVGMCYLSTWKKAFTAFRTSISNFFTEAFAKSNPTERLNGRKFRGRKLDIILEYPDRRT